MLRAECDHERAVTPYCPYCGEALTSNEPIKQVLRHCRNLQARKESEIREAESFLRVNGDNHSSSDYYSNRVIPSATKLAAKWKSWADAVEEAINE
tara:strand:- start:157 stop:444 length:288 start_codon:yes stop_codon:yes gene_type:complete